MAGRSFHSIQLFVRSFVNFHKYVCATLYLHIFDPLFVPSFLPSFVHLIKRALSNFRSALQLIYSLFQTGLPDLPVAKTVNSAALNIG